MNYKLVLKTYSQLRQLTDDETALLNTLRGMNDAERELLAETLGPAVKAKAKPTATKRVIEKCGICDYTRRAAHHKEGHKDYHEFHSRTERPEKSKRASSLASAISHTAGSNHKPALCAFEIDGKVCHGSENDGIHDATMGYAAYHEFQPEQVQAASGD